MVTVIPYEQDQCEPWNRFVQGCANSTFLLDRGYMDYHADRFVDASLMCYSHEKLVGVGVANELVGAVSPDDVTFNFSWSGPELGTPADPFSTLEGALLAVGDGDTLRILSGDTNTTLTVNQSVTLVAEGGTVRIGV